MNGRFRTSAPAKALLTRLRAVSGGAAERAHRPPKAGQALETGQAPEPAGSPARTERVVERDGLPAAAHLDEIFAAPRDGAATGFALAHLPAGRPILWVQDRMAALETGRPHGRALHRFGVDPDRLVMVCARDARDVLWAMEEGLGCASMGAVIGEVWGDPAALDFTATRRLAMRAARSGTAAVLIRFAAQANLSAARRRWRIAARPSFAHPYDPRAPGPPRWRAELFRARDLQPGLWEAGYDAKTHRLDLSAALSDPELAPPDARPRRAG